MTRPAPIIDETVREAWGLECPTCRSDEHIEVELSCWAALTPDGTDIDAANDTHQHWDQQSSCRCDRCGHSARVIDFTLGGAR